MFFEQYKVQDKMKDIDADEDEKYGWRLECPNNGVKCQYLHRLPEGFVILSKKERQKYKYLHVNKC